MKQCSLDARSEEQRRAPFQGGLWGKDGAMGSLRCSRNARPQKAHVGRAHKK